MLIHAVTLKLRGRRITGVALGLAALLAVAGVALAATPITFRFNPPNGTKFLYTEKVTTNAEGSKPKQTQVVTSTSRVVMNKTAKGYTIAFTPVSMSATVNGKALKELPKVADLPKMTYILNQQGKLVTIRGYEKQRDAYIDSLPYGQAKKLNPQKVLDELIAPQRAQWKDEFEYFLGKTVAIGKEEKSQIPVSLYAGALSKASCTLKYANMVKRNGHDCVRVTVTTASNPPAFVAAVNAHLRDMKKQADAAKQPLEIPNVQKMDAASQTERFIDPKTMLIYGEKSTRKATIQLKDAKGKQQSMTMIETKEYSFDYK